MCIVLSDSAFLPLFPVTQESHSDDENVLRLRMLSLTLIIGWGREWGGGAVVVRHGTT